jgi:pyruvate dehydrogenase E2 component (dihydrolipoamide acetyltransferase)
MATRDVTLPDIGDFKDVPIIELYVKVGDVLALEDPILSLESDKATLEVPSPVVGKVTAILVKVGDKVSQGTPMLTVDAAGSETAKPAATAQAPAASLPTKTTGAAPLPPVPMLPPARAIPPPIPLDFGGVHAGPSVRRLARELDVDLNKITGTGEKGRIVVGDVKAAIARTGGGGGGVSGGSGIPEIPAQDFAKFGPVEVKPMSRLQKLSGPHLHRSWLNVPHVTHADEADITDIEAYRKMLDGAAKEKGYRVTLIAFLMKAAVSALKAYPQFNSSLSPTKDALIFKKYYNLGIAVDTPDGLVVPVIKDVDRKGIIELSQELAAVSKRMRDGKIAPTDIQGGTFSISSLGGIGGTHFTPIVSAPEVAILGVVKGTTKPIWDGEAFTPRLMLPLCVSYDHRVIDGATAARFTRHLAGMLEDARQLVL